MAFLKISWLLLLAATLILFVSPLFRATIILCQVDINPCPPEVIEFLSSFEHRPLLLLQPNKLTPVIKRLKPEFDQVQISLELPQTLRIKITSRIPVAVLVTGSTTPAFLVDNQGTILSPTSPSASFPAINLSTPSASLITASVKLISLLNQAFIPYYDLISTQSSIIDVHLKPTGLARFSLLTDLSVQVNSLQLILHKSTIVPSGSIIDVRFNKPVLTY